MATKIDREVVSDKKMLSTMFIASDKIPERKWSITLSSIYEQLPDFY